MHIYKYSGNGNDFLIFHSFVEQDYSYLAKKLCNQKNTNSDGLVILYPHDKYDFKWGFYNKDGSIANMCGNASRCASFYAYENKLILNRDISFLSKAGVIECQIKENNNVSTKFPYVKIIKEEFEELNLKWKIIDTGVPHIINLSENDNYSKDMAIKMRKKYNANVNFAYKKNGNLYVRTFERGVEDETLACGTGIAASFSYAKDNSLIKENKIKVYPKSNEELLVWESKGDIYYQGEVKEIFSCELSF